MATMCTAADLLPKEMKKLINSITFGEKDSSTEVVKIANVDMGFYVLKLFKISSKLFAGVTKFWSVDGFFHRLCYF